MEITSLDKLIEIYGLPIFCKIDVEGYEYEVLQGLSKKIKFISFEYTPIYVKEAKKCISLIAKKFGKNALFNYSICETMQLVLPDWVDNSSIIHQLDQIPKDSLEGDIYVKLA